MPYIDKKTNANNLTKLNNHRFTVFCYFANLLIFVVAVAKYKRYSIWKNYIVNNRSQLLLF